MSGDLRGLHRARCRDAARLSVRARRCVDLVHQIARSGMWPPAAQPPWGGLGSICVRDAAF
eukprot:11188374-Lingulodinium_polyedra.AAC.1